MKKKGLWRWEVSERFLREKFHDMEKKRKKGSFPHVDKNCGKKLKHLSYPQSYPHPVDNSIIDYLQTASAYLEKVKLHPKIVAISRETTTTTIYTI